MQESQSIIMKQILMLVKKKKKKESKATDSSLAFAKLSIQKKRDG